MIIFVNIVKNNKTIDLKSPSMSSDNDKSDDFICYKMTAQTNNDWLQDRAMCQFCQKASYDFPKLSIQTGIIKRKSVNIRFIVKLACWQVNFDE